MKFNKKQYYWADFKANEKALIIQTRSGLGMTLIDYLYPPHIFPLDTDDETLGKTVLQALANSRTFVDGSAEDDDFFDPTNRRQRYDDWVAHLCEQLGYKTKRALFKKMMDCSVRLNNGYINIRPTRHVKSEAWDGLADDECVVLSLDNTPEEIGAGLKLALSRCR